jgi:hypothetical protein
MVDVVHVGDIGTIIYLPTFSGDTPLGASLELFTTRMAWLMRPGLAPIIEISDIPTEIDPLDNILKLKLITGTDTGLVLVGTGDFALRDADVGDWLCSIALAHDTGYWSDGPFRLFTLQRVRPLATMPLFYGTTLIDKKNGIDMLPRSLTHSAPMYAAPRTV